ncbi:MAG: aminotransferase class III-fold pyridoxal phosphate-dependent enzyme, partial [Gemmatimonadaceae bacterium]
RAASLAREHWRLDAIASPLASERDQNFLLETRAGERFVLKIANAVEEPAMIDAQQRAMDHLARRGLSLTPRVVPAGEGAKTVTVDGADGMQHLAWMVTLLDGVPFATRQHRPAELLETLGRTIGSLSIALADFDHPAIHRDLYWDLANGRRVVADDASLLDAAGDRDLISAIGTIVARFDERVAPTLSSLRKSAVHGDLNDYNVLVGRGARDARVSGIVDFGDMVHGYTVADLAIAAAYVALGTANPLADMARVVASYYAAFPLDERELGALFGLIALRLCASACVAARQRRERPDNAYLDISQAAIRRTLPALARIPFGLGEAVFRDACGLEPHAASARVRSWLSTRGAQFAPVLDADLRAERCAVLDLSVASALITGDARDNSEPALTPRIFGAMREAGVRVGVGRYDEPRLLYTAPFFGADPDSGGERRTIHIGLDLFVDAGSAIYAPTDGVVHAFADNHADQDYGPVIILRHATDDGTPFFTLYGHLSRASLDGLAVGATVKRGDLIAIVGKPDENVGWTPHLHLQIITDLLELGTDFPGVARASERAVWRSLCPDPNMIVGIPADRFPPPPPAKAENMAARGRRIGHNLSIAYDEPVRVARGWLQFLFDDAGRRYLDAYNNVPHVGHCHPRVVAAGQAQMSVLNTNTRYLSDLLNEYAGRLAATLPAPLEVCYLVNSASEANELALRLSRAHTGRRDMVVLDAAYHGNTTTLIDLSPYKHAGRGGCGAPDWVHVAPLPDDYRGAYRRDDPEAGPKYAAHVERIILALEERGRGVAAFIAETCPSVGGQIMLPPRYLAEVYRHVRAAGALCIADEVQTGLGRMGTHCWAFETHDVVPDIVVMGKPIGNGHPMAAVVTTAEIAASFDNGMEFFSTFGGNHVSCAIGLAVLDVLRDEALQAHALRVGERLLEGLRELARRFDVIGDVRGSGLFIGVELVRDRDSREPVAAQASFVVNRMRDAGILLGTDGPHHNVIKIRPPMPFDDGNADRLVVTMSSVLGMLPAHM